MNDSWIETAALLAIIFGLLLGYFFVFDYTPADAFFLDESDTNAYLTGKVLNITETSSGMTKLDIMSCRVFNAYYSGQISGGLEELGDNLTIYGSFSDGILFIDSYK
jgi:hypothetical protein